jgi:hypothetical protein
MTDTPKIAPALTALEWEEALAWPHGLLDYLVKPGDAIGYGKDKPEDLRALIALANAALPDDDPRKITRAGVTAMRDDAAKLRARSLNGDDDLFLIAWRLSLLADALESYLPPES